MASELIVDFPLKRSHAHVRFAKTAQLHVVPKHEDKHKSELWYTKAEYNAMKRTIKQDVLQVRARATDCDWTSEEDRGSWIVIAHLLTPTCELEMQACRRRCVRAVLAEQAIQGPSASASSGSEYIALASSAETRRAVLRARKLGKLHQYSI